MDPVRPIRVVLAGWYGSANFGDEMLLATIAEWVRAAGGTPVAISVHPRYTQDALTIDAVPYTDLARIVEAMLHADLFVLGGGGLFQDYDRLDSESMVRFPARNATQYAQYFYLAAQLGLPTVALAQGVGPLRTDASRAVAAGVFRESDCVSVRDVASAELLAAIGVGRPVAVAPDPVWAYPAGTVTTDLPALFPDLRGRKVLGINLRDWPFDRAWEEGFATAFASALPDDWGTVWIDFQRTPSADGTELRGDEIASRMVARLQGKGVHVAYGPRSMREALTGLASCDAVVAMRLHGVLFAHRAGRPVVAIEYDDKVRAMGDALGVPRALRVSLAEIPSRLADALALLTGPQRARFVLSPRTVGSLAESALLHRRILQDAMNRATLNRRDCLRTVPPLLSQWLKLDPSIEPAVMQVLAARPQLDVLSGHDHAS